ncbi:hypothetical protein JTB14_024244 [Gonioctena quinquepunctata]|nr:hypothetical protein JTB14_024244 [Gonioctena quinquepunctata]
MAEFYVWFLVLYEVEVWTLKIPIMNKIEPKKMWIDRRMLKIPWTAHNTNREVVKKEGIGTAKCQISEDVLIGSCIERNRHRLQQLILKSKIESKRGVGLG